MIRFALIGCGKIAPRHAAEALRHGNLVAVCDLEKEKADQLANQFNATPYYSIEELFSKEKDIDITAVCTPNGMHATHSIYALQHHSHVLCEKPLSISTADALQMMQASKKFKKELFVVKSTRYNPALISLKKMISENTLGELYSFQLNCFWNRPQSYYKNSWRGSLTEDGGTLYTQFSHYIDALLWLLGDVVNVCGYRKNLAHQGSIQFEDTGSVAVEMQNGMLGGINWSVNSYQKNMEVSLSLLAEKGSIRIGGEYLNRVEYQFISGEEMEVSQIGTPNDYGSYKGSMSHHDKIYENLMLALKDPSHPFSYAEDGLKTVQTIERIYNSVSLPGAR